MAPEHQRRAHVGLDQDQHRPAAAVSRSSGPTTVRWPPSVRSRLATRSAPARARANFISSEGWSSSGPKPSQRVDPPELVPTPGTSTARRRKTVTTMARPLHRRQRR